MISEWEMIGRLMLAAVLGALIGWEREQQGKPAGLRTLMLVTVACCLLVVGGQQASLRAGESADAVRAMAGIAQGIGFLGAGVIVQARSEVRWLTTAAALWAAAAIGYVTGLGMYALACAGSVLIYVILRWLPVIERWSLPARQCATPGPGAHKKKKKSIIETDAEEPPAPPVDPPAG